MTFFDLLLVILLGGFILYGLWFGLVHTIGAIFGSFAGAFFAGVFFEPLANFLTSIWGHESFMKIASFILIFFIFNRLVGFGFFILNKIYQPLARLPFLHSLDKALGAIVGLFDGILVIGLSLFIISRYPISDWLTQALMNSRFANWFVTSSRILQYLLPEVVRQLRSIL